MSEQEYRHGTWVLSDDGTVRASFDYIGEGYDGDYDEDDPQDAALLRLDVEVLAAYREQVRGEDTADPAWVYPDNGSICTCVRMEDTPAEQCMQMLARAAELVAETLARGDGVKGAMDVLSWLPRSPDDAPRD